MIYITKRDGTEVPFIKDNIIQAINKAMIEVDGILYETDTANDIADDIEIYINSNLQFSFSVENIQDMVENYLMRSERPDVAKAYIRYRYKKEVAREMKTDFFDAIGKKLSAADV